MAITLFHVELNIYLWSKLLAGRLRYGTVCLRKRRRWQELKGEPSRPLSWSKHCQLSYKWMNPLRPEGSLCWLELWKMRLHLQLCQDIPGSPRSPDTHTEFKLHDSALALYEELLWSPHLDMPKAWRARHGWHGIWRNKRAEDSSYSYQYCYSSRALYATGYNECYSKER